MLSALGHDFVLRRNVRVAFSRSHMTPFIKFTHGSHHLQLCDHIVKLHNTLQQQNPSCELLVLPELHVVESGETFGLVVSDHIATFGGLLVKEEDIEDAPLDTFDSATDPLTGEEVDLALQASRNIFVNEWQIDPTLLELPAGAFKPMAMPPSPTKRKVLDSNDQGDSNSTAKKTKVDLSGQCSPAGISQQYSQYSVKCWKTR